MTNVALIRCGAPIHPRVLVNPPLGLLYLAAFIRRHGYQPVVIDLKVNPLSNVELADRLRLIKPEVIGLGAFTPDAWWLHQTAWAIREALPQVPIVAGGPYPTSDPERALADEAVDCLVMGEGEETFLDLLQALAAGRSGEEVAGVAVRSGNGEAVRFVERPPIADLDKLPVPAWDLVDIERYAKFYGASPVGKRRYLPVLTSRGCPYQCTYCHRIFGKRFRARSPESVLAEVQELQARYRPGELEICDDIFNLDTHRAQAICEGIAKLDQPLRLAFSNGLRADVMKDELLTAMKRAGAYLISYAVETASPRLQQALRKNVNLEKTRQVISRTVDMGVYTNGFFMMGLPSETADDVRQTISYACSTRLHAMSVYIFVPFRGSPIYEELSSQLSPLHKPEGFDYHTGLVNCSEMPTREMVKLKRKFYLSFYFNRGRILRTLWHHPRKQSVMGLAQVVWQRMNLPRIKNQPQI